MKPLNRILWNFVVVKNISCRRAYPQEILIQFSFWKFKFNFFFSESCPFLNLEIWPKWNILLKQFVSATPLKPLNRISWNLVVVKDIPCRCAYLQEILIQFFFSRSYGLFELRSLGWIKDTAQHSLLAQLLWNCSTEFRETL